jgi:hypothetical protein
MLPFLSLSYVRQLLLVPVILGSTFAKQNDATTESSECKLPFRSDTHLSEGFGAGELNCAPSTGILNGLVFFVDFPDATDDGIPPTLDEANVTQAADWYKTSSYGRLSLQFAADTSKYYRMPSDSTSYGWQRGLTFEAHELYIQDALAAWLEGTNVSVPITDDSPYADVL